MSNYILRDITIRIEVIQMVTYDYYRIFYYVVQYQSFTRAAKMLNNNQPNITRCMNNLENELNCKLFIRSRKGIKLTPQGHKLYEHIAIAFEQISLGEDELKQNMELENGLITIAASENALHLVLLDKLEAFHEKYPHVRIHISNDSSPQAINSLTNNLVDIAVITTPVKLKTQLKKLPLISFNEILICGSKYKNLSSSAHSLKELSDIPFVSLAEGTGTREMYNKYFLEHGLAFNPDMEAATTDQILPMIQHNLGIGFYPEPLAKKAIENGDIFAIRLKEANPQRDVCIIYNSRSAFNNAAKKFIEYNSD